jgi:hypothetical protein
VEADEKVEKATKVTDTKIGIASFLTIQKFAFIGIFSLSFFIGLLQKPGCMACNIFDLPFHEETPLHSPAGE